MKTENKPASRNWEDAGPTILVSIHTTFASNSRLDTITVEVPVLHIIKELWGHDWFPFYVKD